MQLSIATIALALAATASALTIEPRQSSNQCISSQRATDRFFVSNPDRDNEQVTCDGFAQSCNSYGRNGARITGFCNVDERNVIRARCVLEFGRGSRSVSYTRQVAHNINLGLVVDSDGRCNEVVGTRGKCSKRDFNANPREICQ